MQVFKFGGASVKDAEAVRNLAQIVAKQPEQELVIVISAMGKTTNALEELSKMFFGQKPGRYERLDEIKRYHLAIVRELFDDPQHPLIAELNYTFDDLFYYMKRTPGLNYSFEYDQIVSFGEILSTKIVSTYLNSVGVENQWIDIGTCLKTDNIFREARVDWEWTEKLMPRTFDFAKTQIYVTQGFVGATINNIRTTLGREGSDFTASVVAFVMKAQKVVVWKDVPGFFNADPREFEQTERLNEISYLEAIELTFFGAKIIHPKTIKPLENKQIPLHINSFINPEQTGSVIGNFKAFNKGAKAKTTIPVYIFKNNQILISIQPKDFSFIGEKNLSKIFALLAKYHIHVNLMQNSAISFSVCTDYSQEKITPLLKDLEGEFKVLYNNDLELITIRHYTPQAIEDTIKDKKVLIQQKSRKTVRYVAEKKR